MYMATAIAFNPLGGILSNLIGRRMTFFVLSTIGVLGFVTIALSSNVPALFVGRFMTILCGSGLAANIGVHIAETGQLCCLPLYVHQYWHGSCPWTWLLCQWLENSGLDLHGTRMPSPDCSLISSWHTILACGEKCQRSSHQISAVLPRSQLWHPWRIWWNYSNEGSKEPGIPNQRWKWILFIFQKTTIPRIFSPFRDGGHRSTPHESWCLFYSGI